MVGCLTFGTILTGLWIGLSAFFFLIIFPGALPQAGMEPLRGWGGPIGRLAFPGAPFDKLRGRMLRERRGLLMG
jgi:hypothetical protein